MKDAKVIELDEVAIRFSGDSGDGMQLTGTLFSDATALLGNDISTFPDFEKNKKHGAAEHFIPIFENDSLLGLFEQSS